jgi:hypothetical protein
VRGFRIAVTLPIRGRAVSPAGIAAIIQANGCACRRSNVLGPSTQRRSRKR